MSETVIELIGSRSFAQQVGKRTAEQLLMVYSTDCSEQFDLPAVRRALEVNGYKLGFKFPSDASLSLNGIDIKPSSDRASTWEVGLAYETGDPTDDGGQFEIGPVSQNVSTRV